MREEKRMHPRAGIKWPTVLMTSKGHIFGQTLDLSLRGALIRSWEKPDLIDSFALIFKPPRRRSFMTVTAVKVWATTSRLDSKTTVHVLGVRFTEILDDDLQFLRGIISNNT
jgi:hypothetical protein